LSGLLVAGLLIIALLLVQLGGQAQPLSPHRPLDVDQNLPLPEVGQASTVFSLTALFGAYFGIYLFLGLPALAGVASGTVAALFLIRHWIRKQQVSSFEEFLTNIFAGRRNGHAFALIVGTAQCAYAASELLILRQISILALGMRAEHATVTAVATGIIGYFYVLFGGYMAVYRTDIMQFGLVALMSLICAAFFISSGIPGIQPPPLWPRPGYWTITGVIASDSWIRLAYHFVVGAAMGLGLLAAAPDAWKRVFVITTLRRPTVGRFAIFVMVGAAPFLALLPMGFVMPYIPDGAMSTRQIFAGFPSNNLLFVTLSLGLIASFLSAHNSAILAAVHVGLIFRRSQHRVRAELPRFHWLMACALVVQFFLFSALLQFDNPYLLGNLLLGPFAIVAAIQIGTDARPNRLPPDTVIWVTAIGFAVWIAYFAATIGIPLSPTTYEANTVPGGVLISLVILCLCRVLAVRANDA
jgi:hypothetical protein